MSRSKSRVVGILQVFALVAALTIAIPVAAHADTNFNVTTLIDGPDTNVGDGHCDAIGDTEDGDQCNLRAAVQESNAAAGPGTINLPPNATNQLTIDSLTNAPNAGNGDLDVTDDLTITGGGMTSSIIEGGNRFLLNTDDEITQPGNPCSPFGNNMDDRLFQVGNNITFTLVDVALQGGDPTADDSTQDGGAIWSDGNLTLTRVMVGDTSLPDGCFSNHARDGGGLFQSGPTLNVVDSQFSHNLASESGGGMALTNSGTAAVNGSTIGATTLDNDVVVGSQTYGDNQALCNGGGIQNAGGGGTAGMTLTLVGTKVQENAAGDPDSSGECYLSGTGGGIFNIGPLTLTNSHVDGNYAAAGGGLWNQGASGGPVSPVPEISNSTVSSNEVNTRGAGIGLFLGELLISNGSVVADNQAIGPPRFGGPETGGGIYNEGGKLTIDGSTIGGVDSGNVAGGGDPASGLGGGIFNTPSSQNNTGGTLDIKNNSVVSGNEADQGGGILNAGGIVTVKGSHVDSNFATMFGGGLMNAESFGCDVSGDVTFTDSTVDDNAASGTQLDFDGSKIPVDGIGGGINNGTGGCRRIRTLAAEDEVSASAGDTNTVRVTGGSVSGNTAGEEDPSSGDPTAGYGGGIANAFTLELTKTTLDGNEVTGAPDPQDESYEQGRGGGLYNGGTESEPAPATISKTTFSNNSADQGGGIANVGPGQTSATNTTISHNTAEDEGGGIYAADARFGGNVQLNSVTIARNNVVSTNTGDGIFEGDGMPVTMVSTIVAQNPLANPTLPHRNCAGTITSNGYNLSDDTSCALAGTGDKDNVPDAGMFDLAANGGTTLTHLITSTSPAVDGGVPGATCPTSDQRDHARPQNGDGLGDAVCDIGAVERDGGGGGGGGPGPQPTTPGGGGTPTPTPSTPGDKDGDGVPDGTDNCATNSNSDQADNDKDGLGDECDPDDDNDEIGDLSDNCHFEVNTDQKDADGDGIGDVCDSSLDDVILTIAYDGGHFHGEIKHISSATSTDSFSIKAPTSCFIGRTIKIKKIRKNGKIKTVGKAFTNDKNKYKKNKPYAHGRFFAKAKPVTTPFACKKLKSDTIKV